MKKLLALTVALVFVLCMCVPAMAADTYTVTITNGSEEQTVEVADGEDLIFVVSCEAPTDMGEPADGEEGAGVTTTSGDVAYSDITLGGPYDYPTEETVTITGISEDCTVTVTGNTAAGGDAPTITIGAAGTASDEASEEASDEASGEMDVESYMPDQGDYSKDFEGYREYCIDGYLADSFHPEDLEADTLAVLEDETLDEDTYNTSYWASIIDLGVVLSYEDFLAY